MQAAKLKPLGIMILALLRERDMHPYEMIRLLRARRDERLIRIQHGTFYHQVGALERDGLLAPAAVEREGNRPERTSYTLLPAGEEAVLAWVRAELPRTDEPARFRVALAEAHNLPREEALALLALRIDALRALLTEHREGLGAARERTVDRQFLIEVERSAALIEADIAWSEATISAFADPELAWGAPSPAHIEAARRRDTEAAGPGKEDA